jgi:opacity protein-like surface antigen
MRTKLLLTVSALAMATPALAADMSGPYLPPSGDPIYSPDPMVVGHLSIGVGIADIDETDENVGLFTGAGRANIPFGAGTWNLQLETGGGSFFQSDFSYSTIGAAAHLWTRLNGAAIGVFGGVNFPTGTTIGIVGLEGEAYLGPVTLGADGAYNWGDGFEFWTTRGWADIYATPNWRFGGELMYASGDIGDGWGASLDTEYRFDNSPFSLWAEGAYTSVDDGGDVWAGLVGFRVFMDGAGTTLQQHDQQVPWDGGLLGATLLD